MDIMLAVKYKVETGRTESLISNNHQAMLSEFGILYCAHVVV